MQVDFGKLEKGDTLVTTNAPHYRKNSRIPVYPPGETVMVDKAFLAGVRVKNQKGVFAEYFFEHGAAKLKYTDETVVAIKKREEFARTEAQESGQPDPTLADLHRGMELMNQQLEATKLELAKTKALLQSGGTPGQAQLDALKTELTKTQSELQAALASAQLPGGTKTQADLEQALPADTAQANGNGKGKGK
jgi:hypothetical protein